VISDARGGFVAVDGNPTDVGHEPDAPGSNEATPVLSDSSPSFRNPGHDRRISGSGSQSEPEPSGYAFREVRPECYRMEVDKAA